MYHFLKKHRDYFIVGMFVAAFWSWILFMNVALISKNTILANSLAWLAYVIIVLINTVIYTKAIRYIISKPVTPFSFIRGLFMWAFTEWFTAWILAFVWFGRGGSIDTVFPFASFTAFLMYTPLAFSVRFLGYHGLSALFVGVIMVTFLSKFKKYRIPLYGFCVAISLVGWLLYKNASGTEIKTTIVAEYLKQHQKLESSSTDLVVLPEYGLDGVSNKMLAERFTGPLPRSFVGSQQKIVDSGQVRNIFIYGNKNGYDVEVDKSRLIAGGEYLPYVFEGILNLTNNSKEVENFHKVRGVVKGPDKLVPYRVDGNLVVGGGVCSSIVSTEDYRNLTAQGATVLTNSASLGIFTGSTLFSLQHRGLSKFMAIANARPFLQSSSYGQAFALDHNGTTLKKIEPVSHTDVMVKTNSKRTPYSYLGEWTVILGACFVLFSVSQRVYKRVLKFYKK